MHIYTYMYTYINTYIYIHIYMCINAFQSHSIRVYMYICICTYIYIYICMYMSISSGTIFIYVFPGTRFIQKRVVGNRFFIIYITCKQRIFQNGNIK